MLVRITIREGPGQTASLTMPIFMTPALECFKTLGNFQQIPLFFLIIPIYKFLTK